MSTDSEPIPLTVAVDLGADATDEERDSAARQLRGELLDAGADAALPGAGTLPSGAKAGAAQAIGLLEVQAPTQALEPVLRIFRAWVGRGYAQPRKLKIARGEGATRIEIELDSATLGEEHVQLFLAQLMQPPSGDQSLSAGGDLTTADVIGRDKVTQTTIHAAPGATVIVQSDPKPTLPATP
jgi:hypothetical protein